MFLPILIRRMQLVLIVKNDQDGVGERNDIFDLFIDVVTFGKERNEFNEEKNSDDEQSKRNE